MTLTLTGAGAASASSAFTPSSIAGLQTWYKADAGTSTTTDGVAISQWNDQSGNARHATAIGTAQPIYKAAIVNGKPVVRCDGTQQFLTLPNFVSALTAAEVFIVSAIVADPPAQGMGLWKFGSTAGGGVDTLYPFTDGVIYDDFGTTARKTTVNPTPSLTAFHNYNVTTTSAEWTSRLDGSQIFTTATNTVGFTTAPMLGKAPGTPFWLAGDIAEFILYNAKLSSADRASVESYIRTKYATP